MTLKSINTIFSKELSERFPSQKSPRPDFVLLLLLFVSVFYKLQTQTAERSVQVAVKCGAQYDPPAWQDLGEGVKIKDQSGPAAGLSHS